MAVISGQDAYSVGIGEVYQKNILSQTFSVEEPIPYYLKVLRVPFQFIGIEGGPCPSTGIIWPRNMNVLKG